MSPSALPQDEELTWPEVLGITDAASGRARAAEGLGLILEAGQDALSTEADLAVLGMMSRLQSLHEGVVMSCEANNPHAAFTLLRALAEQCAAIIYAIDQPGKAERLWHDPDDLGVKIGAITNHANRSGRVPNFLQIYRQLSKYAHPSAIAHYAGARVDDEDERVISWQTKPRFKSDGDLLAAYGWVFEFSELGAEVLREYVDASRATPAAPLARE